MITLNTEFFNLFKWSEIKKAKTERPRLKFDNKENPQKIEDLQRN